MSTSGVNTVEGREWGGQAGGGTDGDMGGWVLPTSV